MGAQTAEGGGLTPSRTAGGADLHSTAANSQSLSWPSSSASYSAAAAAAAALSPGQQLSADTPPPGSLVPGDDEPAVALASHGAAMAMATPQQGGNRPWPRLDVAQRLSALLSLLEARLARLAAGAAAAAGADASLPMLLPPSWQPEAAADLSTPVAPAGLVTAAAAVSPGATLEGRAAEAAFTPDAVVALGAGLAWLGGSDLDGGSVDGIRRLEEAAGEVATVAAGRGSGLEPVPATLASAATQAEGDRAAAAAAAQSTEGEQFVAAAEAHGVDPAVYWRRGQAAVGEGSTTSSWFSRFVLQPLLVLLVYLAALLTLPVNWMLFNRVSAALAAGGESFGGPGATRAVPVCRVSHFNARSALNATYVWCRQQLGKPGSVDGDDARHRTPSSDPPATALLKIACFYRMPVHDPVILMCVYSTCV